VITKLIIHILAGGPIDHLPDLHKYNDEHVTWIGVDRGVFTLLSYGITPFYAFGDFDSVSKEEMDYIETEVKYLKKYRPEKDETDMEIALKWAIEKKPLEVRIFGATGGRMDHFFANIQLFAKWFAEYPTCEFSIIDKQNIIFFKAPGHHTLAKMENKKYISFLPFSDSIEGLTLTGFKYSLIDRNISFGSTLCISNELISNYGTYSFTNGILIVIRSQD
jgi:thiamine pyrophosphokinase